MPMVYCYGRASTGKQVITEEAQRTLCENHVNTILVPQGFTYGGWLYDKATSGKVPLCERENGRALWALIQPHDKVVCSKLDRAFRSTIDFVSTMTLLHTKRVSLTSLDIGLDSQTPIGRFVLTIMAAFAELEREFISQRTLAAITEKRLNGRPYGAGVPIGWKKVGKGRNAYFKEDPEERAQVAKIVQMRKEGMSLWKIVVALAGTPRPNGRCWNVNTIVDAVRVSKRHFPLVSARRLRPHLYGDVPFVGHNERCHLSLGDSDPDRTSC